MEYDIATSKQYIYIIQYFIPNKGIYRVKDHLITRLDRPEPQRGIKMPDILLI